MARIIMDRGLACFLLGIFMSYLLGSLPTAYILGQILKRIDIRKFGSGNVGATNAFRVLGKSTGITVLVIDILKGIIPVVFLADYIVLRFTFLPPHLIRIILGLAAVIGHSWTIFLNFKGGKGVATTFGVMAGLAFEITGFKFVLMSSILIWLITLFFFRMVSLASVLTALFFPLFMLLLRQSKELILIGLFFSLFIILRHLPNIRRILQRKEPRLK